MTYGIVELKFFHQHAVDMIIVIINSLAKVLMTLFPCASALIYHTNLSSLIIYAVVKYFKKG